MDLSAISTFFGNSVPIGIVFIIAHQVFLANEIKHIRKDLSNHITETNDKIDRLTNRIDKLSDRFDKIYELLLKDKQNQSSK